MKRDLSTRAFAMLAATVFGGLAACRGISINASGSGGDLDLDLRAKAEKRETVALDLRSGESLSISDRYGSIEVTVVEGSQPRVDARFHVSARTEEEAKRLLASYKVETRKTGSLVTVSETGDPLTITEGGATIQIAASAAFTVTVPPGITLDAKSCSGAIEAHGPFAAANLDSDYGSIEVEDVAGDVRAKTSSGTVRAAKVRGKQIGLHSDYGEVRLDGGEASTIDLESSSGRIVLTDAKGDRLRVHSDYGNLELSGVSGQLDASTSSGAITLDRAGEGPWSLRSDYGNIEAKGASGTLVARTSSGHIGASQFRGELDATTDYGRLELSGVFTRVVAKTASGHARVTALGGSRADKAWSVVSDYGDLRLDLPGDFSCALDAHTDYGAIKSNFRVQVEEDGEARDMKASIGGGGRAVSLRTSSGNIQINRSGLPQ